MRPGWFLRLRASCFALPFAVGAFLPLPAAAEDATLDFSQTTCADLMGSNAARRYFVIWLDGYLAAKRGTTISNGDKMEQRLEAVLKACESDRSQKAMPLMEKQP